MQLDDTYIQANSRFDDLLFSWGLLTKAALAVLCALCLCLFVLAFARSAKRGRDYAFYAPLVACVLLWGAFSLVAEFLPLDGSAAYVLLMVRDVGIVMVPPLLCLHTKRQVSHKGVGTFSVALYFIPPVALSLLVCRDALLPGVFTVVPAIGETPWYRAIFYAYAAAVLVRAYLLCFNVFYQMPRHMRRSTRYVLLGITSFFLVLFLDALWAGVLRELLPPSAVLDVLMPAAAPVAFCFLAYPLYSAMRLMPAEDVIVTSREFVMGGLSTTILVLGRKKQILDWNRKDWDGGYPLPKPLYKEPIDVYWQRVIGQGDFRASPHDRNIITAERGDEELHYLMHTREVLSGRRRFGYVVEISEITPVYTMLRFFEEIAHYDQLTKLNNRNAYLHYVQQVTTEENMPLLIFVGDVNGLKQLNDNHGHILGDQLLVAVAEVMREAAPPGAFTARVGGDEYVVIVPRGTVEIAEKFVRDVIELCAETHHEVFGSPSISWGYAIMTSTEQSYNEIFEKADAMMYAYKKSRHQFSSSGAIPE